MTAQDQGFSIKLSREIQKVVVKVAKAEDRTIKAIVERAIRLYEKSASR